MPQRLTAVFPNAEAAEAARRALAQAGRRAELRAPESAEKKETRFLVRIVVRVVLWSAVGTALGAALGAFFSYTIGPHGTEGLIIQVVSWAIFAHLLIGMWAGYLLLADRTEADLPAVRAAKNVVLAVECANIDDTDSLARRLGELGATSVQAAGDATGDGK